MQKINSKWVKDLNVKPETIKFLGISLSSIFVDLTPKEKEQKQKQKCRIVLNKMLLHNEGRHHQNKKVAY